MKYYYFCKRQQGCMAQCSVFSSFPRMIVCNQVMKYILDKIDKEEKQAAKKRKREESVEQKRSKQNATKLSALLFKHKEQLKAEILKKRALLDKDLQIEVQVRAAPPNDQRGFFCFGGNISIIIYQLICWGFVELVSPHTDRCRCIFSFYASDVYLTVSCCFLK